MGQNWSISDPNGVQMGSNGFLYQFGHIRTHSQPKRTHDDPTQPICHFFLGVDFRLISFDWIFSSKNNGNFQKIGYKWCPLIRYFQPWFVIFWNTQIEGYRPGKMKKKGIKNTFITVWAPVFHFYLILNWRIAPAIRIPTPQSNVETPRYPHVPNSIQKTERAGVIF